MPRRPRIAAVGIPVRDTTRRTRRAAALCVLWLVGVELVPGLHEQLHGILAPHRHDAGSIVTVAFDDTTHRHPDGTIHYASAQPHKPARDGRPRVATGPHGDGLAHHMAALAPAPPPMLVPLPIDRRPQFVVIAIACDLVSIDPLAATARGPPLA